MSAISKASSAAEPTRIRNFADMSGKVAIVTGGTAGIGLASSRVLVQAGADVTICSLPVDGNADISKRLSAEGPGSCEYLQCDVTQMTEVEASVNTVVERHGRLDCLVNNAATFTGWRRVDDIDIGLAQRVLETNILGYLIVARTALPHIRNVSGAIVNIGSLGGHIGLWHDAIYSASKAAIMGLTKSLAMDEANAGVRVNAVLPGNILVQRRIDDEQRMARGRELHEFLDSLAWLGRSGTPEEVGKVVLFLLSEMSSFCTGIGVIVSGGVELGMGPKGAYPDFGT